MRTFIHSTELLLIRIIIFDGVTLSIRLKSQKEYSFEYIQLLFFCTKSFSLCLKLIHGSPYLNFINGFLISGELADTFRV